MLGATERNAYLDIGPERIVAQFGFKRIGFPTADVEFAERTNWPFWGGIGWRSDLRHSIGLIGAYSPVIRIHHRPYRSSLLGIPLTVTDLYLSVDDPDAILAEFSSHASR